MTICFAPVYADLILLERLIFCGEIHGFHKVCVSCLGDWDPLSTVAGAHGER